MFPLTYEGDVFRPPSEAGSLILQATIGCSHNRCAFCSMYKRKKFRVRELAALEQDIKLTARAMPHTRRIFLADGNALAIPADKLLSILQTLSQSFPFLERVSVYGNPQDLLQKDINELLALGRLKLGMIYLGIESGSAAVLQAVNKGVTPREIAEGAARVKQAGIPLSVTVINGLAGTEGSAEHARETSKLLNVIDPDYLGLLSLMIAPGTITQRRVAEGLITPLGPWELIQEISMMVEGLSLTNCVFRANHASNYLPLKAVLSRDQQALLSNLERIIKTKPSRTLRSEFLRGF
ncbi:MAG TPA: radical SAM protein [Candidatus Limnocylindrales bacterium]|nr:radical SAM protein [Candidatus Limnocylindrales bacterium]